MLTIQDWIEAGYKRFDYVVTRKYAEFGLQKLISDDLGKRYYITTYVYDYIKHKQQNRLPECTPDFSFEPDVQFLNSAGGIVTNISLLLRVDSTIQEVEQQYSLLWEALGKPYYDKWN